MAGQMTETTPPRWSPSERTVTTAREVLSGRARGWRSYLAFAGPAVIASIAYMDPGNFATNIQGGAKYGYELLWVVLLANVIAMLFQALSAKLGIVTGKNLAELCRPFRREVVREESHPALEHGSILGNAVQSGRAVVVADHVDRFLIG